ncbi:hypothetical protein [Symmachiella dynata]|uniref:hypothetical protein n=1 Tax=Symmachiella dynata TaxID=2527995 RepID=UPI0030ED82CE
MLETFQELAPSMQIGLILLVLVACAYLLLPLVIKATQKFRADPSLDIFDPEITPIPQAAVEFFESTAREMEQVGFSIVEYVLVPDMVPDVISVVMLFENPMEQDQAIAAVIWGFTEQEDAKKIYIRNDHVEFSTEFDDGSEIGTTNNTVEGAFAPVSHKTLLQFSDIKRPSRLYRVHQRAVEELAAGKKKRRLPPTEQLVEQLKQDLIKEFYDQIATGFLYLDSTQQYYLPTFKGAYLICWKQMWPITSVRRAIRRRRATRLLREWDIDFSGIDSPMSSSDLSRHMER